MRAVTISSRIERPSKRRGFAWPVFALGLSLSMCATAPALAQKVLNDTGLDLCFNDSVATGSTEPATHARQDCRLGRDAANAAGVLFKTGGGTKGFDFTKIANNGGVLPAGAALGSNPNDWACTYDNVTDLMWEVKTSAPSDVRYVGKSYSWYNSDNARNGFIPGTQNGGLCGGVNCDTEAFVTVVNAGAGLCGHSDWRMPTVQELKSLVDYSQPYTGPPAIDPVYFPNTRSDGPYWSSVNQSGDPNNAFYVYFNGGYTVAFHKDDAHYVRLVRSGR